MYIDISIDSKKVVDGIVWFPEFSGFQLLFENSFLTKPVFFIWSLLSNETNI